MTFETLDFLSNESRRYLEDISKKISRHQVVLFAGAGLSSNARRKDGSLHKQFPLWADLTEKMLVRLYGENSPRIEREKYDYLNVADKFEAQFGRNCLISFIEETLEEQEYEPHDIHRLISQFNWEVITTNFDTLIERGYELTNKIPNLIKVDADLAFADQPRIFKINGCIKHAREQIIITSEDFRTFSDKKPLIELYVKKCFVESTVVFAGFSLDDPEFKMLHGWVRDRLLDKKANRFAYSIQLSVDEATKKIWHPRGLRFIELFSDGDIDYNLVGCHLHDLFRALYSRQVSASDTTRPSRPSSNDEQQRQLLKLQDQFREFEEKADTYRQACELENPAVQKKLEKKLRDIVTVFPLQEFLRGESNSERSPQDGGSGRGKWIDVFIRLSEKFLCNTYREAVFYHLLKGVAFYLEKEDICRDKEITRNLKTLLEYLSDTESGNGFTNLNLWVIALYLALRIGISGTLLPVEFFEKGFGVLEAVEGECSSQSVVIDFQRYLLFAVLLVGPLHCAKTLLNICNKITYQKSNWEIPPDLHFHLEAFFANRKKHLNLFLSAVNSFRSTNKKEAFHKFLLLEDFLDEYEKELNDLFITHTYERLSGEFREQRYRFELALKEISRPIRAQYIIDTLKAVFDAVNQGKSILHTGISSAILSSPEFSMESIESEKLKKTSAGELFLLVVMFDIPRHARRKRGDLGRLMTFFIDTGVIDASRFLNLLLFRLKDTNLKELNQESDNGTSRYLSALPTFIFCALPYLEEEDLLRIKEAIDACLPDLCNPEIRESMIRVIGYIAAQLPSADFSNVYKTIFSLAAEGHRKSLGLKYLTLAQKELQDLNILKPSQLRLILDQNLEHRGMSADRDFMGFILNHTRTQLFHEDEKIDQVLNQYFEIKFRETKDLSLQWLMDLEKFISKKYLSLEGMKKQIKKFLEHEAENQKFYFEWKLHAPSMLPVFRRFSSLFEPEMMKNIIAGFSRDPYGQESPLSRLSNEAQESFFQLLRDIYEAEWLAELKSTVLAKVRELIECGFNGGGHAGAFWSELSEEKDRYLKTRLSRLMLDMWSPDSEQQLVQAVQAVGEFLQYTTESGLMIELSNRMIYAAFSSSAPVKVAICKALERHAEQETSWYKDNEAQVLFLTGYLKKEKDLDFLRQFIKFLLVLKPAKVKDTIEYLSTHAPFAEIRRAASILLVQR